MKTFGTYFQNSAEHPLCYGEGELINPPRRRRRGEPEKTGVEAYPVFCGFCGTDMELYRMGKACALDAKFPAGQKRLVNGHEGVVWVPSENRFAIVLIRGGDSFDPTRFTEDETYFEYGCDGADGIFCDRGYFNPDMLLHLPAQYEGLTKLPLSLAKRLVFSDPYACAVFQHERMCDIGEAQLFRVEMAKRGCSEPEARAAAQEETFCRTVIFGLGTTGLFIGDPPQPSGSENPVRCAQRRRERKSAVRNARARRGLPFDGRAFTSADCCRNHGALGRQGDGVRGYLRGRYGTPYRVRTRRFGLQRHL